MHGKYSQSLYSRGRMYYNFQSGCKKQVYSGSLWEVSNCFNWKWFKQNELCNRASYVNVEIMNAAKDSLTCMGTSSPSQLHNCTSPTCLAGLNPIKLE